MYGFVNCGFFWKLFKMDLICCLGGNKGSVDHESGFWIASNRCYLLKVSRSIISGFVYSELFESRDWEFGLRLTIIGSGVFRIALGLIETRCVLQLHRKRVSAKVEIETVDATQACRLPLWRPCGNTRPCDWRAKPCAFHMGTTDTGVWGLGHVGPHWWTTRSCGNLDQAVWSKWARPV